MFRTGNAVMPKGNARELPSPESPAAWELHF